MAARIRIDALTTAALSISAALLLGRREFSGKVVVFDQDLALTRFADWSNGRITDETYGTAVDSFERAVQAELDLLAATGLVILPSASVLASGTDVTQAVLRRVLHDDL